MCGIAGIVSPQESVATRELVALRMSEQMLHRGPDDFGVWAPENEPVALAHRRLSIQDLSSLGHQPMHSASGRYCIAFNGEIYNFLSLKKILKKEGVIFGGGSDTEVILAGLEAWGLMETLGKIAGMFAFALYDKKSRRLTLVRDRLGEKPLFYGWVDGKFVFGSELKAILAASNTKPSIDRNALSGFMRYGYVPSPYTILQNIFKLPPGSYFSIGIAGEVPNGFSPLCDGVVSSSENIRHTTPQSYWKLDNYVEPLTSRIQSAGDAKKSLNNLLQEIIQEQCVADVPIGAFLSGGIDSTLVAAIMQSVNERPINTFTIGFREKEYDEAPYAKALASLIGSKHHEFYVSGNDCLDVVSSLSHYWDEPFADSSQMPALLVARGAKEKVTVCLSGDGGDEFFCGYNRYVSTAQYWARMQSIPVPIRVLFSRVMTSLPPRIYDKFYKQVMMIKGDSKTQVGVGLKMHKLAALLQQEGLQQAYKYLLSYWQQPDELVIHGHEYPSIIDRVPERFNNLDAFLDDAMFVDQLGYLCDDNLVKGDRSSMAVSLEIRLPLMDYRLSEFSWQIDTRLKYRNGKSKWLLRELLYDYVPRELIERPKMGFSVPLASWLRMELRDWAETLLDPVKIRDQGFLNPSMVSNAWHEHLSKKHDHSHKLWSILMWQSWYEQYSG